MISARVLRPVTAPPLFSCPRARRALPLDETMVPPSAVRQLTSARRSHEQKEMGAVLWSILALIFVLLSLPNASREDHAGGYYGEQLLAARGYGRRTRSSEDEDFIARSNSYNWSCEECRENGSSSDAKRMLEEKFLARISESAQSVFQQFTGPLLVHVVRLY